MIIFNKITKTEAYVELTTENGEKHIIPTSDVIFVNDESGFVSIKNTGSRKTIGLISEEEYNDGSGNHDFSKDYLTVEILENNSILKLKSEINDVVGVIQVSLDDGSTWNTFSGTVSRDKYGGTEIGKFNEGDKILIKGNNDKLYGNRIYAYAKTGIASKEYRPFNVYGNIMSLLYGDNFKNKKSFPIVPSKFSESAFAYLFSGSLVIDASNLILPATTLTSYCYQSMFQGCTSLTKAPKLPATTVTDACYRSMFQGCTSLTKAPELPATDYILSIDNYSGGFYEGMFGGCTSLTKAPELPMLDLSMSRYGKAAYGSMFEGCTSLTEAPYLPATKVSCGSYANMFKDCTSLVKVQPILHAEIFTGSTELSLGGDVNHTGCYSNMFQGCTSLTKAPELPMLALNSLSYYGMFQGCTSLTTAPELPATSFYGNRFTGVYSNMFSGCTSLTTAPELPATTLATNCYNSMFAGCTSLTTAPELPATTMTSYCYNSMFAGCTSLTTAPELPSTTLSDYSYANMFNGCTSLTEAPELPATRLVIYCYEGMFQGCSSLNYIKAMFTTTPSGTYTSGWVNGVASSGTFVKNSAATWDVSGVNGIPEGWTVELASE